MRVLPKMNQLGFDIREFGGNTLIIHGMPAEIEASANPQHLVESMINLIKEELDLKHDTGENIAKALARQAAIKRGKSLTIPEMKEMIDKLFACEMPFKSPSGKKCFITFELEDMDKMFY
jgi:DNA mismatch repair protein MutL